MSGSKWFWMVGLLSAINSGCVTPQGSQQRIPNQTSADVQKCQTKNYPEDTFDNGFVVLDTVQPTAYSKKGDKVIQPIMCADDLAEVRNKKLQTFKPLYDFVENPQVVQQKAKRRARQNISQTPWLDEKLDVRNIQDAEKLAKILQKYVYAGWFDSDTTVGKTDHESHFRKNSIRTWCQTPWLNVTEKGREAIHGLTKEFPIRTTHVYTVPKDVEMTEDAVTWGVAFFNEPVCQQYHEFFKEKGSMIPQIKTQSPNFSSGNGSVTFKLLFNTMPDWENRMKGQWTSEDGSLKAYNWIAHVSHGRQDDGKTAKDESIRQLMNVAHIQMDVGLRDSRILGTKSNIKNWIMTTYYFDPNYKNELLNDMDIPEALRHMRPVGLQYGLNAGDTHIFDGAHNNHFPPKTKIPLGSELPPELDRTATRLNGPVDNINGSCLGCHAASGLRFNVGPMSKQPPYPPMVFTSDEEYSEFMRKLRKNANITGDFDFNMQLDKAMRNFVNSKREKIDRMPEPQK